MGVQALGMGLGTLIRRLGAGPDIVTGHDFRSYSMAIKLALVSGLMAAGARVKDIGLALSPMAYFAQFALDTPSVAMVTASHNENGWTGVKMGAQRPLTFGPEEMSALKEIVLAGDFDLVGGGSYEFVADFRKAYLDDLTAGKRLTRRLKVVVRLRQRHGRRVRAADAWSASAARSIPLDTELDHSFPRYNPNPEDMQMLHAIRDKVLETGADVGLGFDGDGDRCGVVDNEGNEIFADKVGVMLARDISALHPGAKFVVDVKSTGLFNTDPVLKANGAVTDYWKTGHSYIKRRVAELGAIAGFEKSGHFFFNPPIGRGYDDGLVTAIAVCEMLDRNPQKSMADLYRDLPLTYGTPTMSPHCGDEVKYGVVERVMADFRGDEGGRGGLCRPEDRRSRHGQRRARRCRGRHLGPCAGVVEQAGTGGGGGKPGVVGAPARNVRGGRCGAAQKPGSRRLQPDILTDNGSRWQSGSSVSS